MHIKKIRLPGEVQDINKKSKLSGTVSSANSSVKFIMAYDRVSGNLIGSTIANRDTGIWTLYVPYRDDNTIMVVCRDEDGDFNADIYDRLSLCSETYSHIDSLDRISFMDVKYFLSEEICNPGYGVSSIESNEYHQDFKGDLAKIKYDVNSNPSFFDNLDNEIDVSDKIKSGVTVNNSFVISNVQDKLFSKTPDFKYTPDLFNDGSNILTLDLSSEMITNVSGSAKIPANGGFKLDASRGLYKPGSALNRDPNAKIYTGLSLGGSDYTISTWINVYEYLSISYYGFVFSQLYGCSVAIHDNGTLYIKTGDGTKWNSLRTINSGTTFFNNAWRNIVFTSTDSILKIFVNGVQKGSWADTGIRNLGNENHNLIIGGDPDHNYDCFFKIDNFRVFDRAVNDAEILELYNENPIFTDVLSATGSTSKDGILKLNCPEFDKKSDVIMPMYGDWRNIIENDKYGIIGGVGIKKNSVEFSGLSGIHRLDTSDDSSPGSSIGDESSLDIECIFKPSSIDGGKQIIWKSGGSTNGLAVGVNNADVGFFGMSGASETSIVIPGELEENVWYRLLCNNNEIKLNKFDNGEVIGSKTGSVVAGNGEEQESVGCASGGSPMTVGSTGSLEFFNGEVSNTNVFSGGTASYETEDKLKIAAEVGNSGTECEIEIEKWNSVESDCIVWIKIPNLSSTSDNVIRLYYDNNHIDNSDNVTYLGSAPNIPVDASQDWIDLRTEAEADSIANVIKIGSDLTNTLPEWDGEKRIKINVDNPVSDVENFTAKVTISENDIPELFNELYVTKNNGDSEFTYNEFTDLSFYNRVTVSNGSSWRTCFCKRSLKMSGKFYFEVTVLNVLSSNHMIGICDPSKTTITQYIGQTSGSISLYGGNDKVYVDGGQSTAVGVSFAYGAGDTVGVIIDIDNKLAKFSKNGVVGQNSKSFTGTKFVPGITAGSLGDSFRIRSSKSDFLYDIPDGYEPWGGSGNEVFEFNKIAFQNGSTENQLHAEYTYGNEKNVKNPQSLDTSSIIATTTNGTNYYPHFALDRDKSLIGTWVSTSWLSSNLGSSEQKFNIDYTEKFIPSKIILTNGHYYGNSTDTGIKDFIIYGTNSETAFLNTTYSDTTDLTKIGEFTAREHYNLNEEEEEFFMLERVTESFRYYVLRIANNYGNPLMSIRRIQIIGGTLSASYNILMPNVSSTEENVINMYYDNGKDANTEYISTPNNGENVWSDNYDLALSMSDPSIFDSTGKNIQGHRIKSIFTDYGRGISFNGADSWIDCGPSVGNVNWTFEVFVKSISSLSGDGLIKNGNDAILYSTTDKYINNDAESQAKEWDVSHDWEYIVLTSDGKFYKNAIEDTGVSITASTWTLNDAIEICNGHNNMKPQVEIIFASVANTVLSSDEISLRNKSLFGTLTTAKLENATLSDNDVIKFTISSLDIDSDLSNHNLRIDIDDATGKNNINLIEKMNYIKDWKKIYFKLPDRTNLGTEIQRFDTEYKYNDFHSLYISANQESTGSTFFNKIDDAQISTSGTVVYDDDIEYINDKCIDFSGGGYLYNASSENFCPGDKKFLIECFLTPMSSDLLGTIKLFDTTTETNGGFKLYLSNGVIKFDSCNGVLPWSGPISDTVALTAGQMYHVVVQRDSDNNIKIFVDGIEKISELRLDNIATSKQFLIGSSTGGIENFLGKMDEILISIGNAPYTTGFTPRIESIQKDYKRFTFIVTVPFISSTSDTIINATFDQLKDDNSLITINEIATGDYNELVSTELVIIEDEDPAFLSTWENGYGVKITIDRDFVDSDMVDFKLPIKINNSSGIRNYDFKNWIDDLLFTIHVNGSEIASYDFGSSANTLCNFKHEDLNLGKHLTLRDNYSLKLDGTISKQIKMSDSFREVAKSSDFSLSFWFNSDLAPTVDRNIMGSHYYEEFLVSYRTNKRITFQYGNKAGYYHTVDTGSTYDFNPGEWYQITVTRDLSSVTKTIKIYVNGKYINFANISNIPSPNGLNDIMIGGGSYYANDFQGRISDVNFFSYTLSDDDVVKNYENISNNTFKDQFSVTLFESKNTEFYPLLGGAVNSTEIEGDEKDQIISIAFTNNNNTYAIFNNVWRPIASNDDAIHGNTGDSNWYFRDNGDTWVKSYNNANDALSSAFNFDQNIMTMSDTNLITSEQYGLIFDSLTGIFNVAVGLKTSVDNVTPYISRVKFNNKDFWMSKIYDLEPHNGNFTSSNISWIHSCGDDKFKVYVIKTGDTEWTECSNDSDVPGITNGMNTTGVHVQFKVEYDPIEDDINKDINLKFELI